MTYAPGIDLSSFQAVTPPLGGLAFVIARATYGITPDAKYGQHIANAKSAGVVTGAYHFGRGVLDPVTQARSFLAAAGDVDLYALDVERDGTYPAMTSTQAGAFIAAVQKAGKRIGLYHSDSGFFDAGQDWDWVANWSVKPSRPWAIWQYGPVTIGSLRIDGDYFDGTTDGLRAWLAGLPDTATGDKPMVIRVQEFTRDSTPAPRGVTGTNVTLWLPDGTQQTVANLASLASGTAAIESDHAPKGSGWILLAAKPYAGWYVAAADVTLAPEPPDPTPFNQTDIDNAVAAAVAADRAKAHVSWS